MATKELPFSTSQTQALRRGKNLHNDMTPGLVSYDNTTQERTCYCFCRHTVNVRCWLFYVSLTV